MDCLTAKQVQDFLNGTRPEQIVRHLADCKDCRSLLLATIADASPECRIPPVLARSTIDGVLASPSQKLAGATVKQHRMVAVFTSRVYAYAATAALVLAGVGIFFARSPHRTGGGVTAEMTSSRTPNAARGATGLRSASAHGNHVIVFDSITVSVGKIPIHKDKESLIRFGGKTGIAASAAAVITVRSRTDTTAFIELTKGNALFSIEKNKYREFVVQTPTLMIVVTGTTFSVTADSAYTLVNVVEGSVRLQHQFKTTIVTTLATGDGAFANKDSITNIIVENSGMLKVRQRLLRDYIEGASLHIGTGGLPGAFGSNDAGGGRDGENSVLQGQ